MSLNKRRNRDFDASALYSTVCHEGIHQDFRLGDIMTNTNYKGNEFRLQGLAEHSMIYREVFKHQYFKYWTAATKSEIYYHYTLVRGYQFLEGR